MVRRVEIAEAALARFGGKALAIGKADCALLVRFVMLEAGRPDPAPGVRYSLKNAAHVLRRLGHKSLDGMVDALGLPSIPVASALPADVVWFPSDETVTMGGNDIGCLGLALGSGRALAFAPDPDASGSVMAYAGSVEAALKAWRL